MNATLRRLRAYFLTGLVIAAPIAITFSITLWFVRLFDTLIDPWLPEFYNPEHYLPFSVPGFGLILAVIGLTVIGALGANFVGRRVIGYWDYVLGRMPVVRSVYKALKQIFETAISPTGLAFQQVGLIEWPRSGLWTLVFVTRPVNSEIATASGATDLVAVYVPTTPNPTGGYMVFVRRKDLKILSMSVEEGMKAVVSLGLVMPDGEAVAVKPKPKRKAAARAE